MEAKENERSFRRVLSPRASRTLALLETGVAKLALLPLVYSLHLSAHTHTHTSN